MVVFDSWAIVMIWCVSSTEPSLGPNDIRMPVCGAFYLHFSTGESWESSNFIYVTLHIENKAAHCIGTLVSIMSGKVRSVCQDADDVHVTAWWNGMVFRHVFPFGFRLHLTSLRSGYSGSIKHELMITHLSTFCSLSFYIYIMLQVIHQTSWTLGFLKIKQ